MIHKKAVWGGALVLSVLLLTTPAAAQGTGTPTDPFVAMSCDPGQITQDIRASFAFLESQGRARMDDAYWFTLAGHVTDPFGDGYYCGWNRYWEFRAEHPELSAGNRADAKLPALHRDGSPGPPPLSPPIPPNSPPVIVIDPTPILSALARVQAALDALADVPAQHERIFANLTAQITDVHALAQQIDGHVQAIPVAPSGPSVFGRIGSWLSSPVGMVLEGIVGTYLTCRTSGKC